MADSNFMVPASICAKNVVKKSRPDRPTDRPTVRLSGAETEAAAASEAEAAAASEAETESAAASEAETEAAAASASHTYTTAQTIISS